MNHSRIINALERLKRLQTDSVWLAKNKILLLSYIRKHPQNLISIKVESNKLWLLGLRPIVAVAMIFVIVFGVGTTAVVAARNVLPTHLLYPVKLTTEKLEGLLIFNDVKKINFIVGLAQKRLQELQRTLVQEGENIDATIVSNILRRYSELINEASKNIDKLATSGSKTEFISAVASLGSSQHRQILLDLEETSASSSEAFTEAQNASLEADEIVINVLKEDEESKKELLKKQVILQLNLLAQQVGHLEKQFTEIKSLKGYLFLVEPDVKLREIRNLLEQSRRLLDRGELSAAADKTTEGLRLIIEIKKDLIRLFGSEPLE